MGGRNILVVSIAVMCLVFFALQNAGAKSKFQEYQDSLFVQIPVKPGDVVNKSNYQLIKDLVPKKFLEYVKNGQYVLTIGKYEYDAECDEEWMQASAKNRGKYDIHPKSGEIIEKASGKYPRYMYGFPFPTIDPKDTFAGSKILFNHKAHEYRGASTDQHAALALVGERTGFEREIIAYWQRYRYWCRPDGEQPNPAGLLSMQFTATLGPYDLAGTLNLLRRPLGDKPDAQFTYIPAVRRIRRLGAADRSQPSLGTDAVRDDTTGWSGRNYTMNWKLIREQLSLQSVTDWVAKNIEDMVEQPDGSWETVPRPGPIKMGYQTGVGASWSITNCIWIPVEVYVVEALAKDPYYAYGKTNYWIEKRTGTSIFKEITNRAGEQWKTAHFGFLWDRFWTGKPGGPKITNSEGTFWHYIDDRLGHATLYDGMSDRSYKTYPVLFMSPDLNPSMFTLRYMRSMAK